MHNIRNSAGLLTGAVPWPNELAHRYRREGYWQDQTLAALSREWCERGDGRVAVVDGQRQLTYEELDGLSDRLGSGLLELGLRAPDRVVVQLPNTVDFVVALVAMLRIGVVPIFALPGHRRHEIDHFVGLARAKGYFVASHQRFDYVELARDVLARSEALEHVVVFGDVDAKDLPTASALIDAHEGDAVARERVRTSEPQDAGDVAMLLLSGGTSGLPKLIPRTHNDYAYCVRRTVELCQLTEADVHLIALPAGHNFPLGHPGLLGTLATGGEIVMAPAGGADVVFELIETRRITHTAIVPALAMRWTDAAQDTYRDLTSVRLWQVGGTRLLPAAARQALRTFPGLTLQQVFGMAEGLVCMTGLDDPEEIVIHTQGRPMSAADECRIVDPDGQLVSDGAAGELHTRGPYTLRGYFHASEHNAGAFTEDGFYKTGDVVRRLASGNLVVEGRVKDMINRGGEKISAEEVENVILGHEAVSAVAVVAMPDPVLSERACAYVVLAAGEALSLEQLTAYMRSRQIASFKLPERLEVVDDLPLTRIGKVDKPRLREDVVGKVRVQRTPESS